MSKIVLAMFASLDGFVEDDGGAMIRPEWSDDLEQHWSSPNIDPCCTLLYGARAFEQNAKIWPAAAQDAASSESFRQLVARMNSLPKVVMSKSLVTPEWNAEISRDDLRSTIERLKAGTRDVIAVGGVTFAANLLAEDLVDEYRLLLLPTLVGGGHSLFKFAHPRIDLALTSHRVMNTGAVLLEYSRKSVVS